MPEKKNPAPGVTPEAGEAASKVDDVIASVEGFYQALTGRTPPPASESPFSPIPVERDPGEFVTEQLGRLLQSLQRPAAALAAPWSPPLSVWEDERELVISLDLAGVARNEVELTLEGNALTVRGRRPLVDDGLRLRLSERPLGPFERRVFLPQRILPTEANAQLRDGVLEIHLAKPPAETAAPREIRVA
jgi:HSP20 family protein